LIDGRSSDRPLVSAELYRDYPAAGLDGIEQHWAAARERAAAVGKLRGLAPLEHSHWDWRNKADSVEAGWHMLVAVECGGETQGLMAVLKRPRPAKLSSGALIYVDYLESAPWNLKGSSEAPRFVGVGTILIADAVQLSIEEGLEGRVGLHSLPQAEQFYLRCGMSRMGSDIDYYDLPYFEFTAPAAINWLASIGESP
jgi:hypothetical protein